MATSAYDNRSPERDVRTITTSSEIFPDGSAIELVGSADGENLALLHWNGECASIAREIRHASRVYRPVELHASIRRAIRLPSGIADYIAPALFRELAGLFLDYIGVPDTEAFLLAAWNGTSWFADCLPSPPPLVVSGPDLSHAIRLFRLNRSLCRRGLILADITRSALGWLPMELRPTIMIAQPGLSDRLWSLWNAANYRGAVIPGRRGTVLDVVCSRALFIGTSEMSRLVDDAIHLALPPARSNLPRLDDRELDKIADKYLPQLLRYRFDHLQTLRESSVTSGEASFSSEPARNLRLCVPDEPAGMESALALLLEQDQDRLRRFSCDPDSVIIEVLWGKLQDPQVEISTSKVADFTNALLLSRGANQVYSAEEVGWKLRRMGIARHKGRDSMFVRFSRETSMRIHKLAAAFGLNLPPHPNCIDCAKPQVIDG